MYFVYLELVNDLTTQCFIACGLSWQDAACGEKYFLIMALIFGEHRLNLKIFSKLKSHSIQGQLSEEGNDWSFSLLSSQHFDGLWEAGAKSIRCHLRRTMGNSHFTFK